MDNISENIKILVITFPLYMIAVTAHEFAHGYVAYLEGDPTAKYAGRLTLNPIDHLDPLGTLCFVLASLTGFGFGWAKPVPVNPLNFRRYRTGDILVSLAGVAANFLLIVLTLIIIKIIVVAGVLPADDFWIENPATIHQYIAYLLWWFMAFNAVLFVFNLLPVPPLDGSHVLRRLLPAQQAESITRLEPYGNFIILGLLTFGVLRPVFQVVFFVLNLIMNLII